jgi:SAM-dependent methyltransferase
MDEASSSPQPAVIEACPICGARVREAFFDLPAMPTVCNQLFASAEAARAVPRGDIRLGFCSGCGFVFNRAFDPALVPYGAHYENSLHFSASFQAHARRLAARLVERYGVRGGRVVEIACGNGEFLSLLCELGGNRGVGYDPSGVVERAAPGEQGRFEIRTRYYREEDAAEPADLVCCRHALEHLEDPLAFLRSLRSGLADRTDTVLYFEVPNATWILEELDLWDLIYEHFGYFTRESLTQLFRRAGFEVLDAGDDFGRQFLWVEARPGAAEASGAADLERLAATVARFSDACRRNVAGWRERLERIGAAGGAAVVWGAGSKGTTFANLFADAGALARAVDVNPHKQGRYVSGTGHPIVSPERLAADAAPELVVVMNPVYRDEIRESLDRLRIRSACEVV